MEKEEKIEILKERNKQTELTFSFVNSIAMGISGIMLFSLVMGYLYFLNFSNGDTFLQEFFSDWNDLHAVFITLILIASVNVLGLILLSKSKMIGWWLYAITSAFFAFILFVFGVYLGYFLSFAYMSFTVLLRIYGVRKIKQGKELNEVLN